MTATAPVPAGGTVLLVEDQPAIRAIARKLLEKNGFAVLDAKDGRDALDSAAKNLDQIDLLLTDVIMPGMSGPELAGHLAALRSDLKILYMSGCTDEAFVAQGLRCAASCLEKPFSEAQLLGAVRAVLADAAVDQTCG